MAVPTAKRPLRIMLADDGSQHALAAVALLCDLLQDEWMLPGSSVTIVGVFDPRQCSDHDSLRASLKQSRARFIERKIHAESELLLGYPSEKLIEVAEERKPDLIVMGAKGLRSTLGILLGGVAQQVVEYACCPVLVVREHYQGLHRILLVTDGSPESQMAINYMTGLDNHLRLPLPPDANLQVMHILPPLSPPEFATAAWPMESEAIGRVMLDPAERKRRQAAEERQGQEILDRAVQAFRSAGLQASPILLRGDAAEEIIGFAKENQVDLIVAGSRGLGPVKAWLLGSVSRKLVHYSGCSTLIVRGENPLK